MTRAARRKRLEALEHPKAQLVAPFGVLAVPPIEYDLDKWSSDAMASQAKLAEDTRAGVTDDKERR